MVARGIAAGGTAAGKTDMHPSRGTIIAGRVVAGPAIERVAPGAAIEDIVVVAAIEGVVAPIAVEGVVAVIAVENVGTVVAGRACRYGASR